MTNGKPDKIVNPNDYDWSKEPANKGKTKYQILLDGNCREVDIRNWGHADSTNLAIVLRNLARTKGLTYQCKVLDEFTVLFQVTGKRDGE